MEKVIALIDASSHRAALRMDERDALALQLLDQDGPDIYRACLAWYRGEGNDGIKWRSVPLSADLIETAEIIRARENAAALRERNKQVALPAHGITLGEYAKINPKGAELLKRLNVVGIHPKESE